MFIRCCSSTSKVDEPNRKFPDLEDLHDLVVADIQSVLGSSEDLTTVFTFISTKPGEQAMIEAKRNRTQKDLLQYFSSMILDPDGHKKWMDEIRDNL